MKANCTRIAVILDRSGSMEWVRGATVTGFNQFIKDQRAVPGEASVKLVQFDNEYDVLFDGPLADVPELTQKMFVPRNNTALFDAQGRTIVELGKELAAMPESERPSKVIVVTLTDGMENASTDFNRVSIAHLVKAQQEKYGWEFVYMGANQDAVKVGTSMNIPQRNTVTYTANAQGMGNVMRATSNLVRGVRMTGQSVGYSVEDREAALAEDKPA